MRCNSWLRRASWPLALGIAVLAGSVRGQDAPAPDEPRPAQDGPAPPGEGPPRGPRERFAIRDGGPGAQFGMALAPVDKSLDSQLKLNGEGAVVVHVRDEGAAAKAGVKAHDIVLAIDDAPVKSPRDLAKAVEESPETERTLKILRAGETLTVTVTPEKVPAGEEAGWFDQRIRVEGDKVNIDIREVRELERTIREKLRNAGVDMRMQFIEPGAFLPRGADFAFGRRTDLPDDLSINIHKQGKEPADIEVKKGEETWTVKENDLAPLPDEVRKHVEGYLGHSPMRFSIVPDGRPRGPGDEGFGPPPGHPDGPRGPEGTEVRRGPRPPRGPEGPDGPRDSVELRFERHEPGGPGGGLERRLEEMARRMEAMQRQLEGLRHHLGEDDDERPRARRPERPEPPEGDDS